jgi:hypothetical protein
MRLEYGLNETRVEVSESEHATSSEVFEAVGEEERSRGRKFSVVVKLDVHRASPEETKGFSRSQLFPRPVKPVGAITPVVVADNLKTYAARREQPMSDVQRVLLTEFLAGTKRRESPTWVKNIEARLDDVKLMRESHLPTSYAFVRRRRRRGK